MEIILDVTVYIVVAAGLAWLFYFAKRKDLLGGFVGGLVVALLGAVLGVFALDYVVDLVVDFLQVVGRVNVLAALLGGYGALYVFNRINHDRTRRDY